MEKKFDTQQQSQPEPLDSDKKMYHEGSTSGSAPSLLSQKLQNLSSEQSKSFIFRVHKALRKVNEEAYEPMVIAIGPYHHNKKSLKKMEEQKLRYLNSLLQVKNINVEVCISGIRGVEKQVRNFYDEPLDLTPDELVEMMVLDGCFIIQCLIHREEGFSRNDPFFELEWLWSYVKRDLYLFENQIPFFILCMLCDMTEIMDQNSLTGLLLLYIPLMGTKRVQHSHGEVKHLLDLIYLCWQSSSFPGADSNEDIDNNNNRTTIPCAIELRKAGVKFEKKLWSKNFMDISFKNGILQIPPFDVYESTEPFLRNLLAHEQYCERREKFIGYYIHFLDCIINSAADVELLQQKGIIQNYIGDTELVAQLFNTILHSVTLSIFDYHYAGIFKELNGYYNKRKNRWMAKLRRNYFNSPWGVTSVIAASIFLLLTLTQTIFTVFPCK